MKYVKLAPDGIRFERCERLALRVVLQGWMPAPYDAYNVHGEAVKYFIVERWVFDISDPVVIKAILGRARCNRALLQDLKNRAAEMPDKDGEAYLRQESRRIGLHFLYMLCNQLEAECPYKAKRFKEMMCQRISSRHWLYPYRQSPVAVFNDWVRGFLETVAQAPSNSSCGIGIGRLNTQGYDRNGCPDATPPLTSLSVIHLLPVRCIDNPELVLDLRKNLIMQGLEPYNEIIKQRQAEARAAQERAEALAALTEAASLLDPDYVQEEFLL